MDRRKRSSNISSLIFHQIPVDELLARVAEQDQSSISSFIKNQHIRAHYSPPDLTQEDYKMDMSDDIFSTLNNAGFPHGNVRKSLAL